MTALRPPGRRESGSAPLPFGVRRDHVEPLWDRIERNRVKVAVFLALFVLTTGASTAVLTAIAMFLAGVLLVGSDSTVVFFAAIPWVSAGAMVAACLGTAVYAARMMTDLERRLLRRFGAVRSEQGEAPEAKRALYEMSLAAGYEYPPPLWIIDGCDRVNAFALGLGEHSAIVGVTRGFLDRLEPGEMRAVFANLMSRVRAGDTLWATAVSAIMGPIWRLRERQFRSEDESRDPISAASDDTPAPGSDAGEGLLLFVAVFAVAVVVTELLMAGHERAALVAAEKADAEGMLLLKDPREMLRGLETVLEATNTVTAAGEAYSMLFYCWAGFGFAPEDDPEMERVSRLREVLGAEGMAEDPASPYSHLTPRERASLAGATAPRIDGTGEQGAP
jgi:Zn-dependent protease with chaperone function